MCRTLSDTVPSFDPLGWFWISCGGCADHRNFRFRVFHFGLPPFFSRFSQLRPIPEATASGAEFGLP